MHTVYCNGGNKGSAFGRSIVSYCSISIRKTLITTFAVFLFLCCSVPWNYVVKNQLSALDSEGHVNHLQKRTRCFRTIGFLWIFDGLFLKTKTFAKGVRDPLGVKCCLLDDLFLVCASILSLK